jgi:hypothetical protein
MMVYPIQYGDGNMGDVTDETVRTCRFPITRDGMVMSFVRAHFEGGSGTADFTLYVDRHPVSKQPKTYFQLYTFLAVGTSKHVHGRWTKDEQDSWQFQKGDEIVIEWTNPDSGNMAWAVELGLTDARD